MRRIAIVGTPGAGKSTLARELGRRAGLPVIHLDRHYFLPSWKPRPEEEWERIAEGLVGRLLTTIHRYPIAQRPEIVAELERRRAEGKTVIVARSRGDLRRPLDAAIPVED